MTSWRIKIDITQRASDNSYVVWERLPATILEGGTEKNWTLKRWVSVAVFRTKVKLQTIAQRGSVEIASKKMKQLLSCSCND